MKNKTDINALEKAVDFIGQYDGNLHDFHDELLVCRAFIHQYKQEIHIAVEDVPNDRFEFKRVEDYWHARSILLQQALEEHNDKRK